MEEKQKLLTAAERIGQSLDEPYLRYLVEKGHPESETFCDYTLFWLRASIKSNESILEKLLIPEKLD